MKLLLSLLFMGACWLPQASAVSRVGNGTLSIDAGASTELPLLFSKAEKLTKDSLSLYGPVSIRTNKFVINKIELDEAINKFDHTGYTRSEVNYEMVANDFYKYSHTNPCIDIFVHSHAEINFVTAYWGINRGVIAVGTQGNLVKENIDFIIDKLQLTPGACSW